jgi:hypothetical protein
MSPTYPTPEKQSSGAECPIHADATSERMRVTYEPGSLTRFEFGRASMKREPPALDGR